TTETRRAGLRHCHGKRALDDSPPKLRSVRTSTNSRNFVGARLANSGYWKCPRLTGFHCRFSGVTGTDPTRLHSAGSSSHAGFISSASSFRHTTLEQKQIAPKRKGAATTASASALDLKTIQSFERWISSQTSLDSSYFDALPSHESFCLRNAVLTEVKDT